MLENFQKKGFLFRGTRFISSRSILLVVVMFSIVGKANAKFYIKFVDDDNNGDNNNNKDVENQDNGRYVRRIFLRLRGRFVEQKRPLSCS
jgi:hypothetical protein